MDFQHQLELRLIGLLVDIIANTAKPLRKLITVGKKLLELQRDVYRVRAIFFIIRTILDS